MDDVKAKKAAVIVASGGSYADVGREIGVGRHAARNYCQKDEVRALIEKEQKRLLDSIPSAVDNYNHWIARGRDGDQQDKQLAYQTSRDLLQTSGILAGNTSVAITNIYKQQNVFLSEHVQGILKEYLLKFDSIDVSTPDYK
jgi:hypothetical protein